MSTSVNYYHYSVNKLLLVNPTTFLKTAASPKKNFRLRSGWRPVKACGFDGNPRQAMRKGRSHPCRPACCAKFFGSGKAASLANTATSTLPQVLSVDKPMHIHRIECAKPRDLATAVFLSSFSPRQTQALFSRLKRR